MGSKSGFRYYKYSKSSKVFCEWILNKKKILNVKFIVFQRQEMYCTIHVFGENISTDFSKYNDIRNKWWYSRPENDFAWKNKSKKNNKIFLFKTMFSRKSDLKFCQVHWTGQEWMINKRLLYENGLWSFSTEN